ncbi:MAG: hypothetical protein COX82_04205, partial [Candidatus Magasanikbacteria bacterium CG_4_10_14_0_2_um_filter_41_10]
MTFFHEYKTFVKTLLFSGLVLLLFFSIVPNTVHAQTDFGLQNVQDQGIALSSQPLDITIVKVIRAVLGFLGLIAVIIVLYGGYVYMTSNGNEDKVSQAKMILRNALIGLTIVFFSFAIVQFILLKLNAAAGGVNPGDTNPPPTCTDVQTCNYNPCDNVFVAQSITPSRDKADINNIVIRAVFTKSVETPANEVFFIQKDTSVDVTRNFTYHFVPGTDNKVIEAIMPLVGDVASQCSAENYVGATECIPLGEYTATINDTVVATDGEGINFGGTACQFEGMKEASFGAITQANDIENPTWQGVGIINPETNSIFTDPEPHIPAGETYTFVGSTNDDNGIAYVHFHLEATDGSETPFDMFRGPSSTMSSADPYSFSRGFFFSTGIIRQAGAPKQYQYSLTTWDIDHHVSETQTGTFVLVGNHCFNGEQDVLLGEYAIDKGGECGTDGACTENYQCASGLCLEGQCVSKPNITAVDPMDGAPGNWVTIRGYYFGLQQGTVEFGTDDTGWIPAHVVECSDVLTGSSWNNTYIIAEVPDNTDFDGTVSEAAIRITNTETNQTDATNDTFGVKPIYTDAEGIAHEDGLFRFNTTVRPGLCAVVVDEDQGILHMGDKAGPPGTTIRAIGTGFGDTQETGDNLTFGITGSDPISAEIFESGWTASVIHSIVPLSIAPGNPLIHVQKGEEISNGVPFRVSQPDLSDVKPLITDIDPSDPTPGSFVTIFGDHFGLAGYVYISRTAEASCTHGSQDDTCIELEVPPAPCKNTWTNSQIIVNIPDDFSSQGNYYVTVERADNGLTSDGTLDTMSIQNGAQKPSICELDPMQGPALLPEEHPGLLFSGKNFTTNPSLYFWNGSGDISDTSTVSNLESSSWIQWNSSSGDDRWNVNTQGTQIHSSVANVPASRYPTMPLGKWPIVIEANNNRGNSVNYFVTDCRIQGSTAPAGTNLQCCPEGPDAGSWKTICEGDVRSSGYVWRFTTGIPPKVPYVLVQCNSIGDTMNPSPVPSVEWEDSEKMCLNATAEVAFSTDIDPATITADAGNVLMYTCGSTDSAINCTYDPADRVTDLDLTQQFDTNGTVLIIKQSRGLIAPNFEPNTWYRVLLTTGVTSIAQDVGGGNSTSTPLRVDRVPENPAYTDADIAFYYDFQTGSGLCSLNSAYITPPEKTVTQIGPLPDVRNADLPFYYYLKGRADRKCTVLNVDDLGWNWSSNRETKATIAIAPSIDYADTRATSTAIEEAADGVTFGAFASTVGLDLQNTFPNGIKANTSTLFINIGPPHVVSYEPNCSASCRDAIIKASFSRHMDPSTYNSGIKVYKCADPNCTDLSEIGVSINVDSKLEVKITPVPLLDPNSYYKVEMTSAILSFGGVNLDTRDGQTLIPFSWVFRTKDDNTLCGVDHVSVTPHPFTATYIGQKTKFTAIPYGAPNECSPKGQELSQASYTYRWDSTVPAVATTTQFAASLTGSSGYCSGSCVPLGSDVTFEEKTTPICGNRIVDAGEDCDIAVDGETVGLTCTLSCLRPGIVQNSDTQPYCGSVQHEVNNPVEHALDNTIATGGEMCDPLASVRTSAGLVSWQPYCTNDCLKKGSSQNFNPNTSGYCGDGLVGLEESCDIGIPFVAGATNPNRSAIGCSRACLHIGTPISEDWCASHADNQFQYVSENDINVACQAAKSVCGNGRTESGEQCEAVDGVLPANCSDTCLLKSTCESATPLCDPAEEDCTSSCLLGGSSLFYSIPSVCGDGVVGLGEYASCEIPQSVDSSKQGGQQLTTAVGQGPTENNKQETTIEANIPAESVTGHADYTLQCGFTEYEAPKNGFYNDCVLPTNGEIGPNGLGVATNSCCYPRPMRTDEYPADGAGDPPICRNTYISVTFDKTVDPQSIAGNAIVARGYYDSGVNCADAGGTDVTLEVSTALHLPSGVADASAHGFWSSLWQGVKNFFYSLVQKVFAKDVVLSDIHTWCSDGNLTTDVTEPSLTIPLYLPHAIGSETEHTAYAVLLRGGMAGIRDINGVGIKHPTQSVISDAWTFEVGTEICKIDQVFVDPTSHLFILPNTSTSFGADAVTVQGQKIVSTPAYSWRWEWQPQQSTIFHIPADNASSTSQFTKMGSTNVEGNVTAVAQAIITRDQSTESNQLGNVFKGNVSLTSKFCENPWPSRNGEQWEPYRDTDLNYSFSYCADAGQSGSTGDDLPFLQINDIALTDASPDVLKRLLFVSDT